jgi:uncharacterized BrkB/YihY/UPF0761 family membrane protein
LGAVGFLGAVIVLIAGQVAGDEIANALGLTGVWAPLVAWARIPVVLIVLLVAIGIVYWLTPNADLSFKWITPGALTFVLMWLVSTMAFAVYVANFANYQATYGTIGGVIILMIWLYITAFALLLGGKINAMVQAPPDETAASSTRPATADPTPRRDGDPPHDGQPDAHLRRADASIPVQHVRGQIIEGQIESAEASPVPSGERPSG